MLPEHELLTSFSIALGIASGVFAWWRKGSQDEDDMVVAAHDLILEALADADATGKVECVTGTNWRNHLTVEQVEELRREMELRRMRNRN